MTVGFVVLGGAVLGLSLRIEPGNPLFYPATLGLAAIWTVGAFASGPLHLGRIAQPIASCAGRSSRRSRSASRWPGSSSSAGSSCARSRALAGQVVNVARLRRPGLAAAARADHAVNGVAEELFFRGAAYAATPRHPVLVTTVAYTVATLATGNVMLTFAAVLLGTVVGLQRRASGGILGADPDPRHLVADDAVRAAAGVRLALRPSSSSARRTASS